MKKTFSLLLLYIIIVLLSGCSIFNEYHIHVYDDSSTSASILNKCIYENCNTGELPKKNNYYDEAIKYNYNEQIITDMQSLADNIYSYISKSKNLNIEELEEIGKEAEKLLMEYLSLYKTIIAQYQYSKIQYDIELSNKNSKRYEDLTEIYKECEMDYYELIHFLANSNLKEYALVKYTEEDIEKIEKEYQYGLNENLQKLINDSVSLEIKAKAINNVDTSKQVPSIYSEIVSNNNDIAKIYDYDSYIEYAYNNKYYRNYNYKDSLLFSEKVKEYISPLYQKSLNDYQELIDNVVLNKKEYNYYDGIISSSFFENQISNTLVNNYIDVISDEDKLNFNQEFENLFANGNYFLGEYEGAYQWYISYLGKPILYFGPKGYNSSFTIVHEFGHYMNDSKYRNHSSYDLMECHSQGNELMYLSYLKDNIPSKTFEFVEKYKILTMLEIILLSTAINVFEIAVYKNDYSGPDYNIYLADKKIVSEEYDALFKSILKWLGINDLGYETYWRNLVTFKHCYYISYAVSGITVLQIYAQSLINGFNSAKNSYLKLFNYYDTNKEYTFEQVLDYAGLYNFNDEKAFELITNIYK